MPFPEYPATNIEAPEVLSFLSPIEEISTTGKTFAQTCNKNFGVVA